MVAAAGRGDPAARPAGDPSRGALRPLGGRRQGPRGAAARAGAVDGPAARPGGARHAARSRCPGTRSAVVDWLALDPDLDGRARAWLPGFADACSSLAESVVPSTVQQDDLHDGNVLLHGTTYRLVDWGDAGISHPFGVFLILRISLARRAEVDPPGPS